ncbi:MAG TPA: FAD-dependent oxidoreductase [Candidatus Angelobacter sp.]|nr:FAD-dependent oxidoreductase [Candidatus Angelobacter sp.]
MSYDFAVIGAGVFGSWTAHCLRRSGASVALLDAYGAANSRASSSGETRIIRMGYGPDDLYTRWSGRSLQLWRDFFGDLGNNGNDLFHRTGVLWLSNDSDQYTRQLWEVLTMEKVCAEKLSSAEIRKRYPQLQMEDVTWGVFEPESGVLMARQAVQAVVRNSVKNGVDHRIVQVLPPKGSGKLDSIHTSGGEIAAGVFIFACGPWLPKLFPFLEQRISPTKQEVFFLGPPSGSDEFRPPKMPVWLHHTHPLLPYALPDIEGRGFKIAFDRHGADFDPDTGHRLVEQQSIGELREYLKKNVPALGNAPIVETRVCQYENTSNGDFLVDKHPDFSNVWLVGGGSGHGFKHGPAMGEYVSGRILRDLPEEPRLSLATKKASRMRAVF